MRYQTVIFDCDYTLGDATDAIVAGYTAGLTALGWPAPGREAVRATVGWPVEEGYTMLTGDGDEDRRRICKERFVAVARPLERAYTPLFPGAEELLRAIQAAGGRAAIVSTKQAETIACTLKYFHLEEAVPLVVGGDQVRRVKPDPEGLNRALSALGRESALYVGDTVIDAETAKRAGVDFAAVLNGATAAAEFSRWPCRYVAGDLWALKDWLEV